MNYTDNQRRILKEFYKLQCFEDSGNFNDDETPVMRYNRLEKEIGLTRLRLKVEILELRDAGIIELGTSVDFDYIPSGSGYILTDKGAEIVKGLFLLTNKKENE